MTHHRLRDPAEAPTLSINGRPGKRPQSGPTSGGSTAPPLRATSACRPGDIAEGAAVLFGAGLALEASGKIDQARDVLERALRLAPDTAEIAFRLGYMLQRTGDLGDAIRYYRRAAEIDPQRSDVLTNLGAALVDTGAPAEAIAAYQKSLALDPRRASTRNNLGLALLKLGRPDEALRAFEEAAALAPNTAEIFNNLGNALTELGRVGEALDRYDQALNADPEHLGALVNLAARAGSICAWEQQAAAFQRLKGRLASDKLPLGAGAALMPLSFTLPYACDDTALIGNVVRRVGAWFEGSAGPSPRRPVTDRRPDRRIRIGYLSPDFGDHPISHVTLPIYALHDRNHFHISCYATLDRSAAGGAYLDTIRATADAFVDLSRADFATAAQRIADDEIDILVDMCGYMRHARPQVLAMRPAPLQVYWQGHTGSLGARYIDYVIGDAVLMPMEEESLYTEQVVRLPDTFSSADRPAISGVAVTREQFGLPENGIVFCAFNNPLKIETETFQAWMSILTQVEGSVLWLTRPSDPAAEINLAMAARRRGLDAHRLIFADRIPDKSLHLARHRLADLFLDTFKFNASTTALDALWAGLPVVARYGNTPHSRLTTSYLDAFGMPELSVSSTKDFVDLAVALARAPERVAALKRDVEARRMTAPLFDAPRFTRHLDYAYRLMWDRFRAGERPRAFDVAVLPGPAP